MNKYTTSLLLFLFFTTTAVFSQDAKFGLKTGLNMAVLSGTVNMGAEFKPGIHFGGYVDIIESERIHFQIELNYSSQGAKGKYSTPTGTYDKINLNYFNVPFVIKIYPGKVFNFQIGAQGGFLLAASEYGKDRLGTSVSNDINENYKSLDMGLVGGFGIEPTSHIQIGARLNYGLNDISTASRDLAYGIKRPSLNNRVFHFFVGYSF